MGLSKFLFNDALSEASHIITATVAGVDKPAPELVDGDVSTCVADATRIAITPRSAQQPGFNGIGLINNPSAGLTLASIDFFRHNSPVFGGRIMKRLGANDLFNLPAGASPAAIASSPGSSIHITSASATFCPSLVFIGNVHSKECFYPVGFTPPIFQPTEDDIYLSDNSLPIGRYAKAKPFEADIPFIFEDDPDSLTPLIKKMQTQAFLWQWKPGAPVVYCWASEEIRPWRHRSPTLLDLRVRIRGYFDYSNVGFPALPQ